MDISENITAMARDKGLDVVTGYFDEATAEAIVSRVGKADVVTGSNAFAHNDRPEAILDAARVALADDGRLCLEVMYAGDLLEQLQWDTLYHEHLTFYSLSSLQVLLNRYGFEVEHAERIPMHGGSLRVVAAAEGEPSPDRFGRGTARVRASSPGSIAPDTWIDFGKRIVRKIDVVKRTFRRAGSVEAHLGLRGGRQSDDVGQCVRDGLSRGDGRRVAASRRQADAGYAHADSLSC